MPLPSPCTLCTGIVCGMASMQPMPHCNLATMQQRSKSSAPLDCCKVETQAHVHNRAHNAQRPCIARVPRAIAQYPKQ